MLFPSDRKLARSRGPWPRIVAVVGLAAFSCTFPDYRFDAETPETCDNGVSDGDETGVDCGGTCDPCMCDENEDCPGEDQICVTGACRDQCEDTVCPPTCEDNEQNGDETDTDCGGSCNDCEIGDRCGEGDDCITKVCANEECQPPACDDGEWNGVEAYTDCGGECLDKCDLEEPCKVDDDCASDTCNEVCVRPHCANDEQDEDETDIDCGGDTGCRRCLVGEGCMENGDCVEGVCDGAECSAPACNDEVANGDETDVDCGGETTGCLRCDTGAHCEADSDCIDKICGADDECSAPACDDEVKNGDESDLDCGGSCDGCPQGDRCGENSDCASEICDLTSDEPRCVSCDDGEQNGSELGLDCGGIDCELCGPGDACTDDAGCVNYLCTNRKCAPGLSLDYQCGQCGGVPNDHIKFTLTLHNASDRPIDVSDVTVRYYLSAEVTNNLAYECEYQEELSCGPPRVEDSSIDDNAGAAQQIETVIQSSEPIEAGDSATLEITVLLGGRQVNQDNDYSFSGAFEEAYRRITLHRRGELIWGDEPLPQ